MIFLAIGFVPFLTACADGCANSIVAQSRSPDGRHRAVLAPDRLQIIYAAKSRIFAQDDSVSGVAISYQPVSR